MKEETDLGNAALLRMVKESIVVENVMVSMLENDFLIQLLFILNNGVWIKRKWSGATYSKCHYNESFVQNLRGSNNCRILDKINQF